MKCLMERVNSKALERLRIMRLAERIERRIAKLWRRRPMDGDVQLLWDDFEELQKWLESAMAKQQAYEALDAARIKAQAADAVTDELVGEGPR